MPRNTQKRTKSGSAPTVEGDEAAPDLDALIATIGMKPKWRGKLYGRKTRLSHYYTKRDEYKKAYMRMPVDLQWRFDPFHACSECISSVKVKNGKLVWAKNRPCQPYFQHKDESRTGPARGKGCDMCKDKGLPCSFVSVLADYTSEPPPTKLMGWDQHVPPARWIREELDKRRELGEVLDSDDESNDEMVHVRVGKAVFHLRSHPKNLVTNRFIHAIRRFTKLAEELNDLKEQENSRSVDSSG